MAIIRTFLCCTNTRTGSTICGYYSLVIAVFSLSFYLYRYFGLNIIDSAVEYEGIIYAGFAVYTLMITASLMLIPGIYMDKRYLLLPWIYMVVLTVLYETGAIALLTMVHIEKDEVLQGWEIFSFVFYCLRLFASFYCFACVVSQYQELSEGRGTYEYFHKPERRLMHRCPRNLFDIDTYELPFGVHLPPYSPDDPNPEYSPPTYKILSEAYLRRNSVYTVVPELHNQQMAEMHNDVSQEFHCSHVTDTDSSHYRHPGTHRNDMVTSDSSCALLSNSNSFDSIRTSRPHPYSEHRTNRISLGIVWV